MINTNALAEKMYETMATHPSHFPKTISRKWEFLPLSVQSAWIEIAELAINECSQQPWSINKDWRNNLSVREQAEVRFAETYVKDFNHGTDGHSRLDVIARLAAMLDIDWPEFK